MNAQTTIQQLGGNKFCAMTGAKSFVAGDNLLQFKIGRGAKNGINTVRINLDDDDTYSVEFWRVRGVSMTKVCEESQVYADRLQATFTAATGLDTKL